GVAADRLDDPPGPWLDFAGLGGAAVVQVDTDDADFVTRCAVETVADAVEVAALVGCQGCREVHPGPCIGAAGQPPGVDVDWRLVPIYLARLGVDFLDVAPPDALRRRTYFVRNVLGDDRQGSRPGAAFRGAHLLTLPAVRWAGC